MGIAADESVLVIARSKICMHCCGVTKIAVLVLQFFEGPCMHTGAGKGCLRADLISEPLCSQYHTI